MSAFIVSAEHIRALVIDDPQWYFFWNGDTVRGTPDEIGNMLWQENYNSVNYRYREDEKAPEYEHEHRGKVYSVVEKLKLISSYEYQSCETDEWEKSKAYAYCQSLRNHLVYELPGYNEAEWAV